MSDFLNSNKLRNEENTLESSYNCGGYALRTFSWYLPYSTSFVDSEQDTNDMLAEQLLFDGFSIKEIYQIILNKNVNFMLQDFSENLRVIKVEYLTEYDIVKRYKRLKRYRRACRL